MSISTFIEAEAQERQQLLSKIHGLIIKKDRKVTASVEKMMGKEMIVYKADGVFKYGLASVKNHMSLHILPIYCLESLYMKYKALLPSAGFQKGCINFNSEQDVPLKIIGDLISDCSAIDMKALLDDQRKSKSKKK
jgi:hypothetical protein